MIAGQSFDAGRPIFFWPPFSLSIKYLLSKQKYDNIVPLEVINLAKPESCSILKPKEEEELLSIVEEVVALIPGKCSDREERASKNEIIRRKLPSLSNYALAYLAFCYGHHLSWRELRRRVDNGLVTFKEACWILVATFYLALAFYERVSMEVHFSLMAMLPSLAKNASQEEIIEFAPSFMGRMVGDDYDLPLDAILIRDDSKEILCALAPLHSRFAEWEQNYSK